MNRTRSVLTGLVLLGLLSLVDAVGILLTDGETPPMEVAVIGSVLGVISLVLVVLAWRENRAALVTLVVLRVVSALTAVPAFVVGGVPTGVQVFAAVAIVLTLLGCALVAPALRRRSSGRRRMGRRASQPA